jgi:hypothetical protein
MIRRSRIRIFLHMRPKPTLYTLLVCDFSGSQTLPYLPCSKCTAFRVRVDIGNAEVILALRHKCDNCHYHSENH